MIARLRKSNRTSPPERRARDPGAAVLQQARGEAPCGGVVASGLLLAAGHAATDPNQITPVAMVVGRWDRAVTVPAMLGTWAFGIGLAVSGGWFAFGWLQAKLLLVAILSAIHGLQSGRIRRLVAGQGFQSSPASAHVVLIVVAIAILAVVKPL